MKLPKILAGVVISVVLAGCATTKPEMTEEKYVEYARLHTALNYCGSSGHMDAGTAAQGLTYISSGLTRYIYYPERLKGNIEYVQQYEESPSIAVCNQLAMLVHDRKQQIVIQNDNAKSNQEAVNQVSTGWPKQTYCNRFGSQTLCTTY